MSNTDNIYTPIFGLLAINLQSVTELFQLILVVILILTSVVSLILTIYNALKDKRISDEELKEIEDKIKETSNRLDDIINKGDK